jgi:hypothetical protein
MCFHTRSDLLCSAHKVSLYRNVKLLRNELTDGMVTKTPIRMIRITSARSRHLHRDFIHAAWDPNRLRDAVDSMQSGFQLEYPQQHSRERTLARSASYNKNRSRIVRASHCDNSLDKSESIRSFHSCTVHELDAFNSGIPLMCTVGVT